MREREIERKQRRREGKLRSRKAKEKKEEKKEFPVKRWEFNSVGSNKKKEKNKKDYKY